MLINLSDDVDFFPFTKMGVAIGVYDAKDIHSSVKKLLNGFACENKQYDEVAKYINYKNDGKALQRVMAVIYENMGGEVL